MHPSYNDFFNVVSHSTQQSAVGLGITEHWNMMQWASYMHGFYYKNFSVFVSEGPIKFGQLDHNIPENFVSDSTSYMYRCRRFFNHELLIKN